MNRKIEKTYSLARDRYAEIGVDTEAAFKRLAAKRMSIQCWQGDDVRGFERPNTNLSGGGILATGDYAGRARNAKELQADLEKVLSLIPGRHRVNLHASYGEFGGKRVDRNEIVPEHFDGWMSWAREQGVYLDFNATLFSHQKASSGFTLSSKDPETRRFWVEHVKRSREVAAHIGCEQGSPCLHNLWIPDGMKDECVDRAGHRRLLRESLDEIYSIKYEPVFLKDSVESKLFGLGSESYVVGSHDFYLGYSLSRGLMVCIDMGHYHPTESVADKISAILEFMPELMLHVSRGVRWDSDHVPVLDDQLREVAAEIMRSDALNRVHVTLDYFDASMNRVGAWVTGARVTLKALLYALLEPTGKLRELEEKGDYFSRLALLEELKGMPFGAVWDYYCESSGVTGGEGWIKKVHDYEKDTLSKRR